jgi:hypothetical protein
MSETLADTTVVEYLKEHPRMSGVLFTVLLLLSQAGSAAAHGATVTGP